MNRLEVADLCGGYDDTLVHRGISFTLGKGEVLGVLGRNGTGKTTLARMIAGLLPLTGGSIRLEGVELADLPPWERRKRGIGYLPQSDLAFDTLTVAENLALIEHAPDTSAMRRRFPRIWERLHQEAGSMSGGERKILGFVRALLEQTGIVVLDEPSEGVQQENILHMDDVILEECAKGRSFILIEQNVAMLERIAGQVIGFDNNGISYRAQGDEISRENMLQILHV